MNEPEEERQLDELAELLWGAPGEGLPGGTPRWDEDLLRLVQRLLDAEF